MRLFMLSLLPIGGLMILSLRPLLNDQDDIMACSFKMGERKRSSASLAYHLLIESRHHELRIYSECNIAEQYVDAYIIR